MAKKAENGDTVAVHYTGKLDSGEVFDSSEGKDPISFELGAGNVIPGFEAAVLGMQEGDNAEVRIEPSDAYGEVRDDLVVPVKKERLPEDMEPQVGNKLQVEVAPGQQRIATITEIGDDQVTIDLNHPLAGKALNFELELVKVE